MSVFMNRFVYCLAALAVQLQAVAQGGGNSLFANLEYENGVGTKNIVADYRGVGSQEADADAKAYKKLAKQVPAKSVLFGYKGQEYRVGLDNGCQLPPLDAGDKVYLTVSFYRAPGDTGQTQQPLALVDEVTLAAAHSQTAATNEYRTYFYTDNLNRDNIPGALLNGYYDGLKKNAYRTLTFVDEANRITDVQTYTKKAQSGFLYVNKLLMDKAVDLGCADDAFKVDYRLNGRLVAGEKDAQALVALMREQIELEDVVYDKEAGRMTAYIKTVR